MKKSMLAASVGAVVIVTTLLCMNPDGKMYVKQKHFDTANDVLMQLETNKIIEKDEYGRRKESDEFKECLSKRKRLTNSEFDFDKIKIEKIEELSDEKKKSLIDEYNNEQQRLALPYKRTKVEPVRVDIKGTNAYSNDNKENDYTVDFVMVDEGEGMVIDYCVIPSNKNSSNNEGSINDKG